MFAMCASTVFGARNSAIADRLVRATLGHQREHLALALGQVVERHPRPTPAHELGDDLGVDHRAAPGDRRIASAKSSRSSTRSLSR